MTVLHGFSQLAGSLYFVIEKKLQVNRNKDRSSFLLHHINTLNMNHVNKQL